MPPRPLVLPLRSLLLIVVSLLFVSLPAVAQHAHDHKPRHGGLVKETGDLVYELVVSATEIAVFVTDEGNKPVATAGASAKVTLIDSGARVEVPLAPAGDNRLAATGTFAVKKGMSALLQVSIGGKEIARLRYTLK